ncbi:hypothetical protein EAH78_04920 [Pseudomonas arsenicoxydans]|uniref:Uncharacterized protein n=1 Tax=Pseudomonas arsenicoxydans TaxID=702115 RepID=A0A502I5I6_9PSED|nr:hypothetical protein EAH78_04920 [Pseudomonas arsenicoxydans]
MSNLGICDASSRVGKATNGRFVAPLIKKCAILAISCSLDQLYAGKYDECCAMLRAVRLYRIFTVNISSVT